MACGHYCEQGTSGHALPTVCRKIKLTSVVILKYLISLNILGGDIFCLSHLACIATTSWESKDLRSEVFLTASKEKTCKDREYLIEGSNHGTLL